jgi:predicted nucleotidyltransferase
MDGELQSIIAKIKSIKPDLVERYHLSQIAIFGSYARCDQTPESDLDVLVSFSKTPDLFDLASLNIYLENELGIKIDLVPDINLKPRIAENIYAEKIDIE